MSEKTPLEKALAAAGLQVEKTGAGLRGPLAVQLQPLKNYDGTDPPKVRAYESDCSDAEKISKYINSIIDALNDGQRTRLTYGKIAVATGIDQKLVHKYCLQLDSNTDNSIELSK